MVANQNTRYDALVKEHDPNLELTNNVLCIRKGGKVGINHFILCSQYLL